MQASEKINLQPTPPTCDTDAVAAHYSSSVSGKEGDEAWQNILSTFLKNFKNPKALSTLARSISAIGQQNNASPTSSNTQKKSKQNKQRTKQKKSNNEQQRAKTKVQKPLKIKEPPKKSIYEKRQRIIINPSEIRRIQTPDWTVYEHDDHPEIPSPRSDFHFDIVKEHHRLEVCEYRIINGIDKKYGHPAYCIDAADESEDLNLLPFEIEKYQNYECKVYPQKVPTFWPPRVWDKEDNKFSQDESDQLLSLIVSSKSLETEVRRVVRSRTPSVKPKSRKSERSRNSIVKLPMTTFDTDSSSDETDF
ncbi:hypothetical protein GPJ56_008226 [Histomonas meleagridis]|uniref:uncharacterized protein n=1 Tax=Histomonas meleagridis TaxID=135588 RepID=UPI00355ABDF4|nr:hypothetical protein GPJ56_008226 [Histomonas meleagridis]KAH0797247.1 hypothetical protein GO595_009929 [Histomonas meleagridis]